jgi:hypothetical protein
MTAQNRRRRQAPKTPLVACGMSKKMIPSRFGHLKPVAPQLHRIDRSDM